MRRVILLLLIAALVIFGYCRWEQTYRGGGRGKYTPAEGPKLDIKDVQVLSALDSEYTKLVDSVVPSVVSVATARRVRVPLVDPWDFFFGGRRRTAERTESSLGSGVIVSKEGHILTNHHVIANMDEIRVQLTDGRTLPAQLIGSDADVDIAVLKINASNISPLPLGNSDQVRVGQMVFAVGNPFGLQETVTQGIISAKGRSLRDSGVEFLQTDAAVNRGNSGGPLLNLRGEIIGINSAIYSETGGWLGISFAIPANVAKQALDSIVKTGHLVRGYLGVSMMALNPALAQQFGLRDTNGALITDVLAGSPAEKAGLKAGDVIRTFNGRPVEEPSTLRSQIANSVGQKVQLGILREGRETTVTVEVAEMPPDINTAPRVPAPAPQPGFPPGPQQQQPAPAPQQPQQPPQANVLSGVDVAEIPPNLRSRLPENVQGVIVTQVQPDSAAVDRLRVGDVIEEVNNRPVRSVDEYNQIARKLAPGDRAVLYIARGRTRSFLVITP